MLNRRKTWCCLGVGVLALCLVASPGMAQDNFAYNYTRPGRAAITVYLWGEVGSPGIWRVEPDIDLIELLSAARVRERVDEPGISQLTSLRIYREEGGQRNEIYNQPMDQILSEARTYPTLQDGDILEVVIRRRRRIGLQTIAQAVGAVSSLTLLILRLANL